MIESRGPSDLFSPYVGGGVAEPGYFPPRPPTNPLLEMLAMAFGHSVVPVGLAGMVNIGSRPNLQALKAGFITERPAANVSVSPIALANAMKIEEQNFPRVAQLAQSDGAAYSSLQGLARARLIHGDLTSAINQLSGSPIGALTRSPWRGNVHSEMVRQMRLDNSQTLRLIQDNLSRQEQQLTDQAWQNR